MNEQPTTITFNGVGYKRPLYPANWPAIAFTIKEKANWQCQQCHHHHSPSTGYTLTVHHKDHNTFNNSDDNLKALCQRCHLKEEGKYRHRLATDRRLNALQAAGQQILPTFGSLLFPQLNIPNSMSLSKD